jgi:hypothetical protein
MEIDPVDYWREVARLRGELIGYLMSRNTALAGHYINLIEKFQKEHRIEE